MALELSQAATVRTADGRHLDMRLVVGWDSPTPTWLDDCASDPSELGLALALLTSARDGIRALRYRLAGRTDWWTVRQLEDDEPEAVRHVDLGAAIAAAEQELLAAVAAGGTYRPYGRDQSDPPY